MTLPRFILFPLFAVTVQAAPEALEVGPGAEAEHREILASALRRPCKRSFAEILAAIPAVLVALTQGPRQAGMVILMYIGVHFVEGNFITPLVQAEVTALPPVLALLATIGVTMLFGPVAVLLAAPLTLFAMVVIKVLWVEQVLVPRKA